VLNVMFAPQKKGYVTGTFCSHPQRGKRIECHLSCRTYHLSCKASFPLDYQCPLRSLPALPLRVHLAVVSMLRSPGMRHPQISVLSRCHTCQCSRSMPGLGVGSSLVFFLKKRVFTCHKIKCMNSSPKG
jgi:hypothetical protein